MAVAAPAPPQHRRPRRRHPRGRTRRRANAPARQPTRSARSAGTGAPRARSQADAEARRRAHPPELAAVAGRTAVAVRELPDSGLIVRMTRGRAWIGVLGVLLVGIVALNVVTLSFAASAGKIDEQITALDQENSMLARPRRPALRRRPGSAPGGERWASRCRPAKTHCRRGRPRRRRHRRRRASPPPAG